MYHQYLTRAEAQAILRVSKSKMFRLIHEGELPAIRVGSTYLISKTVLENYLKENNSHNKGEKLQ